MDFVLVDILAVLTVIGMVGGLLFSYGAVGRSYMDLHPPSAKPKSFSLSYIFVMGVGDFE